MIDSPTLLPAHRDRPINVLAYVHLRNIHRSTGAGRTARQITEHLARRPDVHLEILADRGDMERILPLVQQPWTGFRHHTFAAETSRQQARWFLTDRPSAEKFWPAVQVMFCTAESYVPVRSAALVVTAHDAGYFEAGAHRRDANFWKTRLKWTLLYKKLERKVDMFHTVSEFSAERLAHFFPSIRSRIQFVHNGVTPYLFGPVDPSGWEFLETNGLRSRPFVLIPGGLQFRKNAELILSAAPLLLQRHPDLLIVIINHSDPAYAAAAASVGPRLVSLGFVSDEALHALYTAATVVWYPSRYEGFGLPVVEAMACGACVVASESSSIPEIAGDAAVLVDPALPAAHIEAIGALLEDAGMRQGLSVAGKLRARRFTWESCAASLRRHFGILASN